MIICLHSGGIDSTTMLYSLHATGVEVVSLAIDYGQRHVKELESAHLTALELGVRHERITIPTLQPVKPEVPDGHYTDPSMKATVAPNRNMVFLALATAMAVDRKAGAVAYAAHAGDHPIYPDCRPEFIDAMQRAIHLGNYEQVDLIAPFRSYSKTDIVTRGDRLKVPWALTWSCYRGAKVHCGTCGTCVERREAFELAGVYDPTHYAPKGGA
jgi:7-cyano-7-deazaguanine synthase